MMKVLGLLIILALANAMPVPLLSEDEDQVCRTKDGVPDDVLGNILSYLCGILDCSEINPGGQHYLPNTAKNHADIMVNKYFQLHRYDVAGYLSCYFQGAGEITPPIGNLLFLVSHNVTTGAGLLNHTVAYPSGVGVFDTIDVGADAITYTSQRLSMTYNASKASTTFSMWAAGLGVLDVLNASVYYDFDGDLQFDRVETYKNWNEDVVPQYDEYTNKVGFSVSGSNYQDLKNGIVQLRVASPGGASSSRLLQSTNAYPSVVIIPYN